MMRRDRLRIQGFRVRPRESYQTHETFPCNVFCGDCRYLADPGVSSCPHCGSRLLLDLADIEVATRFRDEEQERRMAVSPGSRRLATLAGVLAPFLLILLLAPFVWILRPLMPDYHLSVSAELVVFLLGLVLFCLAIALARLHVPRLLTWWWYKRRPVPPARWRLPLPQPEVRQEASRVVEGSCEPKGPLLVSPVSGTECVGYRVAVLFDAAGDARPPEWVLEEVQVADFSVGGLSVVGAQALIVGEYLPTQVPEEGPRQEQFDRFLRQRGLFSTEGEYRPFEVLLPAYASCRVRLPPEDADYGPEVEPGKYVPPLVHLPGSSSPLSPALDDEWQRCSSSTYLRVRLVDAPRPRRRLLADR